MDIVVSSGKLENMVFVIRGQKVMLDKDLAALYSVRTKALNQAVKRNVKRFPDDFMFHLTREEIERMSQTVTSLKTLKFYKQVSVFTEHGVAMLSSVLNSERAILVNIQIMRTFSRLREIVAANKGLAHRLDQLEKKYDGQFRSVFDAIRGLMASPEQPRKKIGFHPPAKLEGPGTMPRSSRSPGRDRRSGPGRPRRPPRAG